MHSDQPYSLRNAPTGLSIVIPNWNHEMALPRSIASALAAADKMHQQNVACEVLVIDDASRDGSATLIRQLEALYYEQGLRALIQSQNTGVVAVRNQALLRASYQYILFMDADNELVSENVPLFYRSIAETGAAVVYGNLIVRGPVGRALGMYSNESVQPRLFVNNYLDTFALYDRAQLFDARGFVGTVPMHEDWELFLHLAANGKRLVFVPLVFGIYYEMPVSRIKDARSEARLIEREAYITRVYDQLGIRQDQPLRSKHLRYHPDIGYL